MSLSTAVKLALFSSPSIIINPETIAPQVSNASWALSNLTKSTNELVTTLSEDGTNGFHGIFINPLDLADGGFYSWSVWARAGNRRFIYITTAPANGASRFVTVWGLDGQGLLDTKQTGNTIDNVSTSYRNFGKGIYKCTLNYRITSGGFNHIPIIGLVDTFPPTYTAFFDITFQGLAQPSLEIHGTEFMRTA